MGEVSTSPTTSICTGVSPSQSCLPISPPTKIRFGSAQSASSQWWRPAFTGAWMGPPTLTDRDVIVLAEFTNTTDDPVFDGTLRPGRLSQLEQSPFFELLTDERIAKTLETLKALSGVDAGSACVRAGGASCFRKVV